VGAVQPSGKKTAREWKYLWDIHILQENITLWTHTAGLVVWGPDYEARGPGFQFGSPQ
jgi:hypothetical protein